MLSELHIRNFAIIDELTLRLGAGLHILTGETGAGKSIIVDAVALLLGGRADTEVVRAEADFALVEGTFTLDAAAQAEIAPILAEGGLESEGETLILSREVRREGRNICRINGRAVTLRQFQMVGERLIDIHGQGDHLSLLRVQEHINFLDRYGGLMDARREVADLVHELRGVRRELRELQQDERELARRVELLHYQVSEINAAALRVGEEEELLQERTRLANAEQLQSLAEEAYHRLYEGGEEQLSATDLLGQVEQSLAGLCRYDVRWETWLQAVRDVQYQLDDLARELRDYGDRIEYNPSKLARVEERLNLYFNLKRKYGDTVEEVLEFCRRAAHELETITHSEERIAELQAEEQRLLQRIGEKAARLSAARKEAAQRLSAEVERELADLAMEKARFVVDVAQDEAPDGVPVNGARLAFDATGIDRVEFLVAPNVGEPLKPMVRIASGGETSRLLLALKTVLSEADQTPTLIFDEIDTGIGGRVGVAVGRKLWTLASRHQVLCVTHLPQIAAYADRHLAIRKEVVAGRTVTRVEEIRDARRVDEIAQMLGSVTDTTRESAQEMLERVKSECR
ncbi:MAG: DNA repair protein RecN [Chloroflexi bacterium]|nr:DNA repair protein RecN [Chloroflexota bacterium]